MNLFSFGIQRQSADRQKEARGRQKQHSKVKLNLEIKLFFNEYTYFKSKKSETHRQFVIQNVLKDLSEKKTTKLLEK